MEQIAIQQWVQDFETRFEQRMATIEARHRDMNERVDAWISAYTRPPDAEITGACSIAASLMSCGTSVDPGSSDYSFEIDTAIKPAKEIADRLKRGHVEESSQKPEDPDRS